MNDKKMNDQEYKMRCIERIKEMFKIGLHTDSYSPAVWEYIERKAGEYNIYKDLVKILSEEINRGL